MKKIFTIVLIIFVAGSLAYMISKEQKTKPSEKQKQIASKNISSDNPTQDAQLVVYYFHGDLRCPTCHKLETYAKEALDIYFSDEIALKKIVWKVVNIDKPENRHFIKDYQLVTKSVVLSQIVEDREIKWKNLELIWQKVGDKDSYLKYVRNSLQDFLEDTDL